MQTDSVDRDEALDLLAEVRWRREHLDLVERELVAAARRLRVPWREIAVALGVTTGAAHKRFRALDPRSKRRVRDPVAEGLEAALAAVRASLVSTREEGSDPATQVESGSAEGR